MTSPIPFSIRSLEIAVVLAALAVFPLHSPGAESGGAKGSPLTEGWTRVPLKYDIQKAWDVDVSQRHSYDPTTDTHRLWTLRGDKPHAPPPNRTGPRAELRFWNEYYTGEHLFEAEVYIVRYLDATVPKKLRRDGVLSEVMGYSCTYLVENLQGAEATRDYFLSRPDDTADLLSISNRLSAAARTRMKTAGFNIRAGGESNSKEPAACTAGLATEPMAVGNGVRFRFGPSSESWCLRRRPSRRDGGADPAPQRPAWRRC